MSSIRNLIAAATVIISTALAPAAQAWNCPPGWLPVVDIDPRATGGRYGEAYIDNANMDFVAPGIVSISIFVLHKKGYVIDGLPTKKSTFRVEIDCRRSDLRIVSLNLLSDRQFISTRFQGRDLRWSTILPDSNGDVIARYACWYGR